MAQPGPECEGDLHGWDFVTDSAEIKDEQGGSDRTLKRQIFQSIRYLRGRQPSPGATKREDLEPMKCLEKSSGEKISSYDRNCMKSSCYDRKEFHLMTESSA